MQLLDMTHAANSYSPATNSALGICYGHPSITYFISKETEVYVLYDTKIARFYKAMNFTNQVWHPQSNTIIDASQLYLN